MKGLLSTLQAGAQVPVEEIRFGVILNGGVSLAVWMGGACLELDRLVKAGSPLEQHARLHEPSRVYATLLRLAGCTARVDVIAGTSAGGINGAALALAQTNAAANIASLRDIWVDQGRIETLMRQPFRGAPTSLLRGDEFFLPRLNEALGRLAVPNEIVDRRHAPVDLTITTTVLGGNQTITVDSMGQRLPQLVHAGKFRWKRRPDDDAVTDPFSEHEIAQTADRLALASRSTASFPIAFEPSFVPVDSGAAEQKLHPNMRDVVRGWGPRGDHRDHSKFVVDGGLLANTPTKDALRAVDAMPAAGPVRRVMLLVYPHAEPPGADPAADPGQPPTVTGTVAGLMDALTAQGSRTFVDELEDHNKQAAGRRGTRGDLVRLYGDPQKLDDLTAAIYPQYRQLRLWRAARDLAAQVSDSGALPDAWNYERVRRAAESAQRAWEATEVTGGGRPVPYVPLHAPTAADVAPDDQWAWGVTTALGVAEAAGDLLRRLIWVLPASNDYATVERSRRRVSTLTVDLFRRRAKAQYRWTTGPLATLPPNEKYWELRLAVEQRTMLGGTSSVEALIEQIAGGRKGLAETLTKHLVRDTAPGQSGLEVRAIVAKVVEQVAAALPVLEKYAGRPDADAQLTGWRDLLCATPGQILPRLLQLEVAATTLGDEVRSGLTLPLEVVQLSAQTQNAFAQFTLTGNDKLGGMSVNRFGGFLKRSWRVNDWTWGRIDAATTLSRIVLQPARVRRAARLSGLLEIVDGETPRTPEDLATATVAEVLAELFHPVWQADARVQHLRAKAVAELTPVLDLTQSIEDLGASLPALADLFAWAQQLESVPPEIPALARAIRADAVDGANRRSRGELFLAENASLIASLEKRALRSDLTDDDLAAENWNALGAFDRGGIGGEPLAEEGTSDQMIRTATTAAAVVATVVDSERSGLGSIRVVTRPLRGAMLLPYWVVTGLSSRTALGRGLALLGLAFGGALLALSLFGVLPQILAGPAVALGAGAVLGALAFGAMRSGTILHGLVLLTPIIPLVAYAGERAQEADRSADRSAQQGIGVLVAVLALLAGLMVLGSLPATTGSVFGALDRLADRQHVPPVWRVFRRPLGVVVFVVRQVPLLLLAALVVGAVFWVTSDRWARAVEWVNDHLGLLEVIAGGCVAVGALIAFLLGRQLQVLRPTIVGKRTQWQFQALTHPAGATAGWAVLYGTGYLLIARFLLDQPDWLPWVWARALLVTAALLGVVLVIVVPIGLPLLAIWRIFAAEVARAMTVSAPVGHTERDVEQAMVVDMTARGVSYRVFMAEPKKAEVPELHRLGPMLKRRIVAEREKISR